MRNALIAIFLVLLACGAAAQSTERPRPPGTLPFQEPPPPPPLGERNGTPEPDPSLEPQVTVRYEGGRKIEEYRVHGKLYMQKVTPPQGRAYVLMDHKGDGTFTRLDNTLDQGVRVPQWVLLEF